MVYYVTRTDKEGKFQYHLGVEDDFAFSQMKLIFNYIDLWRYAQGGTIETSEIEYVLKELLDDLEMSENDIDQHANYEDEKYNPQMILLAFMLRTVKNNHNWYCC